ncbi:hypothetical protein [Streptomyces sp. NBC_01497]|uniref:hypothetical protein n=1 Tax=Streptomyces sp. NBC_01497 TaxID=2903885 RepID=UPI002E2F8DC7|nr:hypothetical protein [Streptomyces sp. NBC_01497]
MTGTEERLRAALAAKAATVTRADLRHPLPPSAGRVTHRLRTASLLALAAALIGAALLLPGALRHQADQPPAIRPQPTASPSSSPPPAPAPVPVPARGSARGPVPAG